MSTLLVHRYETSPTVQEFSLLARGLVLGAIIIVHITTAVTAQGAAPLTSSGLGTQISDPISINGQTQYNITGGYRPLGANGQPGGNLFHSFGDFNVPTSNIANFLNNSGLATSNILGRVTGGNPSSIFGTIQTASFGNANLFLINPAGIILGPTATLNVGGSVTFATANNLRLTDGVLFNAAAGPADALLSAAPVAAFGFLGPNFGTITVQGSNLFVPSGQSLNLVAGDIVIGPEEATVNSPQAARITAPEGQINLVSVASDGEVLVSNFQPAAGMTLGSITLGPGTLLDVSGDAAGTVRIRSGQLVMDNATISADTIDGNGAPLAVDIQVTNDLSITADLNPAITARATGAGDAGEIRLVSGGMRVTSVTEDILSVIHSETTGAGKAGNVTLRTGDLEVTGDPVGVAFFINSGTTSSGPGGNATITAKNVSLNDTYIVTGDPFTGEELSTGAAGHVNIAAETLTMNTATIEAQSAEGRGGNISISVRDLQLTDGGITASGYESSGAVTLTTDSLMAVNGSLESVILGPGPGGNLVVSGKTVELIGGSQLITSALGDGNAGSIQVTATDYVTLSGSLPGPTRPSGIFSNSFGVDGPLGSAGSILVTTPTLTISNGARINTATRSSGRGGDVLINTENISISGELPRRPSEGIFGLGNQLASGIFTSTIGSSQFCAGVCGNAGHVSITTGSLNMSSGANINSGTSSSGQGGNVFIGASGQIAISGTLKSGAPVGIFSSSTGTSLNSGSGGNIALTAGQSVTISDGASVSASSTGPGNAGNIAINAGQQFEMRTSSVKTEAAQASGGNIDIQAIDRIRLVNSSISTSVLGGAGSGGNITIDPNVVILQNSRIIAQAVQGSGGNISITTPLFLADAGSLVDASSQFGLNGTVNIQSPTSNLAGTISSLPSSLRQVQSLQTGRCAALADSRSSSLIVAGRDILPAEPGGWSPSPFALMGEETDSLASASPPVGAMIASADAPVSLRRLTPAGFLTQSFAESGLAGCRA